MYKHFFKRLIAIKGLGLYLCNVLRYNVMVEITSTNAVAQRTTFVFKKHSVFHMIRTTLCNFDI